MKLRFLAFLFRNQDVSTRLGYDLTPGWKASIDGRYGPSAYLQPEAIFPDLRGCRSRRLPFWIIALSFAGSSFRRFGSLAATAIFIVAAIVSPKRRLGKQKQRKLHASNSRRNLSDEEALLS
jgi:hypothetical protein